MQLLSTDAFEGLDAVHGFTTRVGGLSLARSERLPDAELAENWERVAAEFGLSAADVALLTQVHGAKVVRVTEPSGPLNTLDEADAMWTDRTGVLLAVRVADCVPVLLAAPGGVAVAHAGWRGVAAQVVRAAVEALCHGIGVDPEHVCASVGPHISGARYEVGQEVVDGLGASGLDESVFVRPGTRGRPHVDLGAAVGAQLEAVGVGRVRHLGACTYSESRFHSYRRDGPASGRLAGVIVRMA